MVPLFITALMVEWTPNRGIATPNTGTGCGGWCRDSKCDKNDLGWKITVTNKWPDIKRLLLPARYRAFANSIFVHPELFFYTWVQILALNFILLENNPINWLDCKFGLEQLEKTPKGCQQNNFPEKQHCHTRRLEWRRFPFGTWEQFWGIRIRAPVKWTLSYISLPCPF